MSSSKSTVPATPVKGKAKGNSNATPTRHNANDSNNSSDEQFIFKPYGPDEVHPSKIFNDRLNALSTSLTNTANEPLDFGPGDLPKIITVIHPERAGERVGTQSDPNSPERELSSVLKTISASDLPALANAEPAAPSPTATDPESAQHQARSGIVASAAGKNGLGDTSTMAGPIAASRGDGAATTITNAPDLAASVRALGENAWAVRPNIRVGYAGLKEAQSKYSPHACIFVGNLPADVPDEILGLSVLEEFGFFGKVYGCAFRGRGIRGASRPYAILQFTKISDAREALEFGADMQVWGRPVRVERSNRRFSP